MAKIYTVRFYFQILLAYLITCSPNRSFTQVLAPVADDFQTLDSAVFGQTAARGHARCELRKIRDCVTKTYTLSAWQVQGANQEQVQAAWNTGDFGHSIVVSPPGFFSWDASPFTCDHFLNSTNIPAFFPEATLDILGAQAICPGEEVVLTLNDDGYPFASYQWNPPPFIPILSPYTVTNPGAYSITVTDLNGCTYTDQVVIPQSPPVNPNILGTLAMCSTGSTNTLSVTPSFSSYQWSNGASTNPISVSDPGGYSVTVTNQFGCTNSVDFEVANADIDDVVVSVSSPTICPGANDTLRVFGFYNQYAWSTGAITSSLIVNQPGQYTVTVSNAFGCTGEKTVNVAAAPVPAPTLAAASICPGSATVLMPGGGGFSQYNWSSGQTTSSITTSQPGTYTVTVTNANGCTASAAAVVSAAPAANVAISGPTQICAPQSGVLAASSGLTAYTWSTGATTSSIPVSQSGTFTVTVSNGAGCTATAAQTFTVNPQPNPTATAAPYNCNGQIALNASGSFAQYQWSSGASTASTSVTQSGTYTVTVTTAAGCTNTAETTANIPPAPQVNIAGPAQLCVDVSGQLTASGSFAQYRWSLGGQTTPTITVPQPGTYTVTVTDAFGCTDTETHVVALAPPLQTNIAGPSQICINSTGQLTATGSFANYTWSTGATTQNISVSQSGNYTVTVSDLQGCTGTAVHALVVSTALIPQITPAPYTCNLKITLSAGLGFASYQWSNGSTSPGIVVGSDGTYSVTVTDATGCSGTASETVVIPALPQTSVVGAAAFCTGLTGQLAATGSFAQYAWTSGGQPIGSGATLSVNQSGTYTVVVTDANGCTASASQPVVVHPLPQPAILGPVSICIGNSATFTAGNFAQYNWSTGSTAASINTTQSGTYTVTVTDVNGCTGLAVHTLSVAASLAPIITPEPYQCDSRVQISAGTGFTTYNWSNGQTAAGISVQNAGTYTVTVSDASGCTGTAEQTVTIPANPQASISGPLDLCPAEQGQLLANAGLAQYDWTGGLTGQIVSVSQTGTYILTVTDFNGCTATSEHVIVPSPNLQTMVSGPLQICIGGTGTLSVSGTFAQYAWSTGSTGASIATQNPGTYTVTVTNSEGCTGSAQHVLNVGTSLAPQIVASPYQCDGKISISAGLGFDVYQWSNGASTSSIAVQNDGSYSVTVSDATGCTGTAVQTVTIPTPPSVDINGPNALCLGVAGPLAATTGFVGYQWSTGATTSTASVLPPGVFTVTVTDAFGCTDEDDFTVVLKPSLVPTLSGPPQVCFGASGNLTVNQNFEQYLWSTGATTQVATVSATGNYTVTVTDDEGCTGTGARAILVMPQLIPTIAGPTSICAGETATLTANGGPFIDTYDWSTMATTKNITVSLIGSYSVTVTDVNGCTGTDDYQLVVYLNNQTFLEKTSCHVQDTGIVVLPTLQNQFGCDSIVTIHTSLIPPPVTFLSKKSCFVADTGVVEKIWLTPGGCDSIVITHTELWPQVAATASVTSNHNGQQISCFGGADGAASVAPTSGTAPFSANWSTGAAGLNVQNLAAGSYLVTVTDANGCRTTTTVSLAEPPPLSRSVLLKEVQCFEKGGITIGYVAGGTAPYSLVCNGETAQTNGSTAVTFDQLLPGTYTVEITDANGCTLASPATLVPPTADVQLLIGDTVWAYRGHEVQLVLPAGFDTLADFEWKKSPALSCLVCPSPIARLWKNEDFTASYTGYGDCEVVGLVPARVKPDPGYYVPNVIQTEDDDNGTFTIFGGPELLNIKLLRVFTRWGELVQELRDFPPNGPTGWKGEFRGQFVTPGVYVFYAEIELANGETKALKGDVTVIR